MSSELLHPSDLVYAVVGGGMAGAHAVEALRADGVSARIVLIGDERDPPYERPPLSKEYLAGRTGREKLLVHEPDWYAKNEIELMLGTRVTAIDRASGRLELGDGGQLHYDRLLLATGSVPRKLRVPGSDLDGVHYLRRVGNSDALRDAIRAGGPLVVVGGGWIGLEVAAVARQAGLDVTLVESAPGLLGVLGPQVGERFAALHRGHGVDVRTGSGVEEILGSGRVEAVRLAGGEQVPAAAVLIGVGIRPLTELAEAAGLPVDNGVLVDATLRTADPAIWAAGDVANAENDWVGHRVRVEHFANATDQGPFAARNMAGAQQRWAKPPFFWTDQYDLAMEYRGWADPAASTVVLRGGQDDPQWFAFWLDGSGAVRAGMHVNAWDDADQVKALVEGGVRVDAAALADPGTGWDGVRAG
jgi:3-phenylpropionate/trans-cinnamate dioxygenase ferredoxin reductase subunit